MHTRPAISLHVNPRQLAGQHPTMARLETRELRGPALARASAIDFADLIAVSARLQAPAMNHCELAPALDRVAHRIVMRRSRTSGNSD